MEQKTIKNEVNDVYKRFKLLALKNNIPFQVEIDITNKCNANCPFCFQGDKIDKEEMSYDLICKLLDELKQLGTYYIGFSGGEPFCRNDFLDILKYAKKLGFRISIITNAQMLTKEIIDSLENICIDRVTVSFHSLRLGNYLYHFGISNEKYYQLALENFEYLSTKKISIGAAITLTSKNIMEVPELKEYFLSKGLSERDINYNNLLTGKREVNYLRPNDNEITNMNPYFNDSSKGRNSDLICAAGRISCTITPNGLVYPCTFFNSPMGDLKCNSLKEIWTKSHLASILRNVKLEHFTKCTKCDIRSRCNMCLVLTLMKLAICFCHQMNIVI